MPNIPFIDPAELDQNIKPTDDFFQFVNGAWMRNNPVPPDESRWGSFFLLRVQVEHQLKAILEEVNLKNDSELDVNARKVRDFYRTGMDVETLNTLKDEPLRDLIGSITALSDIKELAALLGKLHRAGVNAFWGCGVDQDLKQSEIMALYLGQAGLGLPDRDYYLNDDEKSAAIRTKYLSYIETILGLSPQSAGAAPASKKNLSEIIFEIEKNLAVASMTRVELRDYEKQYNKMKPGEIAALAPRMNWGMYFEALGAGAPEYTIVCQPKFLTEVDRILETVPLEEIKLYLRWRILSAFANFLSEDFEKAVFDFYGRTFSGAMEMKPRWRRVLGVVNSMLDEAVGQLYVARHFSAGAKEKMNALVTHLTDAYRVRIEHLDWMSEETKKKALAKLGTVTKKLGYPDKWKDFSALQTAPDSYVENYMRAHAFETDRQMKKIGKPVDRSEWYMSPQTVNACYQPPLNEILFPAAILQEPFFDEAADDAVNFGGIGTVIGHELTHGFDDQGALFDQSGNLKNWWTAEDKERFDKQTTHLAEQYDKYEPLPGLYVNGKLTLGENIADLGGMLIAYDGLTLALGEKEDTSASIDGLTPYQRFFINYAITERMNIREEALRLQVQTDPHSPSPYRVNGPLSNLTEFYEAFDCKLGDSLYREPTDRVNIW